MQIFRNFYRQKVDFFEWPVLYVTQWEKQHFPLKFLIIMHGDPLLLRQDPLKAILVIFGRRALIFFFVWKLLEKNEKWRHFCAHA